MSGKSWLRRVLVACTAAAVLHVPVAARADAQDRPLEEEIEPDPSALAVAKIAQGDYEGAIAEYHKLMETNPMDRFPVVEIANIYMAKLEDPDRAVAFLEESLNDKEWSVDDAAYLMFRTVDIDLEERDDPVRARELLTLIVENFEGTRHAANAEHRIEQIDAGTWATS